MIEFASVLVYIFSIVLIYISGLVSSGMFLNWARKMRTNIPISGLTKRTQRFALSIVWPITLPMCFLWIVVYKFVAGVWKLYAYFE